MPYNLRSRDRNSSRRSTEEVTGRKRKSCEMEPCSRQFETSDQDEHREQHKDELMCSICLEIVKNKAVVEPCLHSFDLECIDEWAKRKHTCPICRADMDQILYDIVSDSDYKGKSVERRQISDDAFTIHLSSRITLLLDPSEVNTVWIWTSSGAEILSRNDSSDMIVLGNLVPTSMYRLRGFDSRHRIRDADGTVYHLITEVLYHLQTDSSNTSSFSAENDE